MSSHKRHHILVLILSLTAIIACLLATSRTNQDPDQQRKHSGRFGSAEEAFDVAGRVIKDYVATLDSGPIRIDPQFRATLHSQSKLWTIKGYASCLNNEKNSYSWTVILNYHDMKEWEVLAKIVTPEFSAPNGNQIHGPSQAQGKLFQPDGHRSRQDPESQ